jgi:hypothetical protein
MLGSAKRQRTWSQIGKARQSSRIYGKQIPTASAMLQDTLRKHHQSEKPAGIREDLSESHGDPYNLRNNTIGCVLNSVCQPTG